ncbi:hypothetical protein PPACK8108_LOCUS7187 [Phakopsora pachyrhizi]|uniref:STAS domain-containing protein n=1 Tax=Phakopsora pachyrhizi TaxID=170000 RepID=A0AAV0ASE4_PHAPC|nr:hypothetical protein PPACK8108_LOCUS7187 [Phakopsora pachyrhizi]
MTVLLSEGRVTFVIVKNRWETSYARETAGLILFKPTQWTGQQQHQHRAILTYHLSDQQRRFRMMMMMEMEMVTISTRRWLRFSHASLTTIVGERDPLAHSNNHNPSQESSSSSSNLPYGSINDVTINDASLPVSITKQRSRPTTKPSFLRIIPQALGSLPPVTLGLMMNILDGVSYGLIMFPSSGGMSGGPFKEFGGIGVSMFFVTCIISQLVYSLGGSSFSGATGSMMIESVPFMHVIANKITKIIGPELPERIIATTMVAFALSSIFTGFAFFLLGPLRMGKLMGFGIMVGIVLACLSFVVTSSQHCAIRSVMDGRTAISTVRRHPTQHTFLKKAGTRTRVLKLQGHLFFRTISACKQTIKNLLNGTDKQPIQFLIVDFSSTVSIDFSAVKAFLRIYRRLRTKSVILVICGVKDQMRKALRSVGLWSGSEVVGIKVFEFLNEALEHCENELLKSLYFKDSQNAPITLYSLSYESEQF